LLENPFAFEADEDTIFLFNGILFFLVNHFGHAKSDSDEAINQFYKRLTGDDGDTSWLEWFHHEGVYLNAMLIEYEEFPPNKGLQPFSLAYDDWRTKTNLEKPPFETFRSFNILCKELG